MQNHLVTLLLTENLYFHQQIGLAVGDIDKIQQKSAMARYVMQV